MSPTDIKVPGRTVVDNEGVSISGRLFEPSDRKGGAPAVVAAGLVIGGVGAWYLSAAAKTFLFRLDSNDPRAFVAAVVSLSLAAFVASAIPARRAASVDPMVALRAE